MRLLVVGHSYITAFAQAKYAAMKRLAPDLELLLIIPPRVYHPFMTYRPEVAPGLASSEVVCVPTLFGRSTMTYLLDPRRLAGLLREFSPDRIHIEEDPHSFVGVETVLLSRRQCPDAKVSFFIWDNLNRSPRFPVNVLKRVLTRYALACASDVVCGNTEGQRLLKDKGYNGSSAILPQIGLEASEYMQPPRAELMAAIRGEDRDGVVIGYVGRLVPEKGILTLLEALSGIGECQWRLVLLGQGPLREKLERQWKPRMGQRLVLMDAVSHGAVAECMKCFDVFVLASHKTSRWTEQFGLALAQAMMAGVACVGSSSGAIPEVLAGTGLLVQERDAVALREALRRLISCPEDRKSLGRAARELARAHYTNEVIAAAYLRVFEGLREPAEGD